MFTVLAVLVVITAGCDNDSKPSDTLPSEESPPAEASSTAYKPIDGDVTIEMTVTEQPDKRIRLHGTTNLPNKTNLILSIEERMQGGFFGQSKCSVASDGSFSSEAFGAADGLKDGLYIAGVIMPIPRVQSDDVRKIIGENGEHLSGPHVKNSNYGVTISAKKEFTIGGERGVLAQQQRIKAANDSIANLKLDICVQLEKLLAFKDKQDFKTYGFGRGGPYHEWLKDVQALRDSQPVGAIHPIPLILRAAPGHLLMLGMQYMQKQRETEYTQQILPELQQTIGYADYLATKIQRDRNDR
jgi:hypothetical protein